ncbi:hypothetical protein LXA43DRAFT_1062874 [Ganoderma leucocontextum]|nr:hypothetical protein LXA43DRAFT_1062874 [Ganoderma leucocontextum]
MPRLGLPCLLHCSLAGTAPAAASPVVQRCNPQPTRTFDGCPAEPSQLTTLPEGSHSQPCNVCPSTPPPGDCLETARTHHPRKINLICRFAITTDHILNHYSSKQNVLRRYLNLGPGWDIIVYMLINLAGPPRWDIGLPGRVILATITVMRLGRYAG